MTTATTLQQNGGSIGNSCCNKASGDSTGKVGNKGEKTGKGKINGLSAAMKQAY